MKIQEVRALSDNELRARLDDTREELMKLRFQMVMGGLTDHTRLRQTRRTIARILTIIDERATATREEGEA